MTALIYCLNKKRATLSHRKLLILTEFYYKTIFVLINFSLSLSLQETMFSKQKCPEILRVVANLHGREMCFGALRDKT